MPDVEAVATQILERIEQTGKDAFNEANTCSVLIEPLLAALGWDVGDPRSVSRQYRVYDNTLLDFALMLDGIPALFLEAKAVGRSLESPQFIAQAVNYANNEGVRWCVLTNALIYRVYKTNESVAMAQKLMFEVSLRDMLDTATREATLRSLDLLGRASLEQGRLETVAELTFLGARVRTALDGLLKQPTPKLLGVIEQALGESVDKERLLRVLSHFSITQHAFVPSSAPIADVPVAPPAGSSVGPASTQAPSAWTPGHHLSGIPQTIVDLYQQLDERLRGLGADLRVTYAKYYINYSAPKRSFVTAQLFKNKIKIYTSIPWADAPKPRPELMRDVTAIGHYGMGETEFVLSAVDQLPDAMSVASAAYVRNREK